MSSRRSRSGGTVDDEGAEPEIQILPKRSGIDGRAQIAIGRRDDAGVDLDVALTADAPDLALLQRPQQLRLDGGRDFADLVEEDRAVAGDFEQAGLVAHRARERPAHVSEQLGLQQRLGEGRAVDADEGAAARGL